MSEISERRAGTRDRPETTQVHVQRFAVSFDYPVYFTHALFALENPVFAEAVARLEPERRHRIAVFIDASVAAAHPSLCDDIARYAACFAGTLELAAAPRVVPGGEACKNDPRLAEALQRRLLELGIDRHSCVVAVGGGAVLDMVGYVAATTHRGVRLLRVPTTVLAQNDSGVGVKTAINAFGVKNFLGVFAPPFAVLNDFDLLASLPPRERRAGLAEAVKVALIRDAGFFAWLETQAEALVRFEAAAARHMIRRCSELHMHQIAHGGDPFETGSARPLDYGHWSAHKLESLTRHTLRHGEAVAIGIALDARYAVLRGLLEAGAEARICRLLERLGFRLWDPALLAADERGRPLVLAGLREFREHLGGELTITLLEGIGTGIEVHEMDEAAVLAAIAWLQDRDRAERGAAE